MIDIFEDRHFWMRLQSKVTAWLAASSEKEHRRCWIDGITPVSTRSSTAVAVVRGTAWVFRSNAQSKFSFLALVPWAIANHPSAEFEIAHVEIDSDGQKLEVEVLEVPKQPNKAPEPTPGPVTDHAVACSAPSPVVAHL